MQLLMALYMSRHGRVYARIDMPQFWHFAFFVSSHLSDGFYSKLTPKLKLNLNPRPS